MELAWGKELRKSPKSRLKVHLRVSKGQDGRKMSGMDPPHHHHPPQWRTGTNVKKSSVISRCRKNKSDVRSPRKRRQEKTRGGAAGGTMAGVGGWVGAAAVKSRRAASQQTRGGSEVERSSICRRRRPSAHQILSVWTPVRFSSDRGGLAKEE